MTRSFVFAAALSWLTSAGCASRTDPEELRASLMAADRAFAQATAGKGLQGWVAYFADNGAMLPAGQPLVRGKEAIRNLMQPVFENEDSRLVWEPTEADASGSGDLGYTIGRFERSVMGPDGTETTTVGKYVTIWKKQADGTWKVVVDIGTPNE